MPGTGKYTTYVPEKSDKTKIRNKLFKGSAFTDETNEFLSLEDARKKANENGNNVLRGMSFQAGPAGLVSKDGIVDTGTAGFGKVDLTYQYRADFSSSPEVPDLVKVTWEKAKVSIYPNAGGTPYGGPANAYVPDISSPGSGKTDGVDKETNPNIAISDIKPGYVVSDNTKSPSSTAVTVRERSTLPTSS